MADVEYPLALVTGAGHRLGRAFALGLAQLGYAILLHYHSSGDAAGRTASAIRSLGPPAYLFSADLTSREGVLSLFSYGDSLPHRLRVLVNSAAVMRRARADETSEEDWESELGLNLRAPFFLAQQAAARMASGGTIINISDVGAQKNWSEYPAYVISKSGLETLTRVLARAYAPAVRVNAVAPGLVLRSKGMAGEQWHKLVEHLPLKRSPDVQEVVSALEFLVKNEAITGQVLVVDSGFSLL